MANKQVKNIGFKGIERVNQRINCNEGACEEIINIRPDGNTWRNIGKRKEITNKGLSVSTADYQVIIHPASKDKYYIVRQGKSIDLFDKTSERQIQSLLKGEDVLSVSFLDNVLVVCTQDKKYFFLYDVQQKQYKEIDMNINANIVATGVAVCERAEHKQQNDHNFLDSRYSLGDTVFYVKSIDKANELYPLVARQNGTNIWKTNKENFNEAIKSYLGYMEEALHGYDYTYKTLVDLALHGAGDLSQLKIKDTFRGLSFYRVAFKLYDGSYISYSNITFADTNGDSPYSAGSGISKFPVTFTAKPHGEVQDNYINYYTDYVAAFIPYGQHVVKITLPLNRIQKLMEEKIILSVDLFMTRPVFSVDIDGEFNIEKDKASNVQGQAPYIKIIQGSFPINDSQIKEQLDNGIYYKVKSFDKEDIDKNIDGILYYVATYKDISSLEGNDMLPTPTTDNDVLFENSYTYNQKQHLYNLYYNIFQGYDYPLDDTTLNTGVYNNLVEAIASSVFHTTPPNALGLYYTIKGEYDNETFAIKHKIENPDKYIEVDSNGNYSLNIPRLFSYPLIDKVSFGIYIIYDNSQAVKIYEDDFNNICDGANTNFIYKKNNKKYYSNSRGFVEYTMKNNTYKIFECVGEDSVEDNKDSYFTIIRQNIDISSLQATTFNIINRTHNTNILQLTATDNPFVLPNEDNYNFADKDNEIMSVCSNVGLTTDRNFGMYPLYVFCSQGIYTMAVGSGGIAYSSIIPVTNIKVINKNTISLPTGVMFLSLRGLCVINGKNITCLSDLVKGEPTVTSAENLNQIKNLCPEIIQLNNNHTFVMVKDLSNAIDTKMLTALTEDFLSQIEDSQMYYDQVHNEVCIVVSGRYTYVYNLSYNVFYKRSDCYQVESAEVLSLLETEQKITIQTPFSTAKKRVHLYEIEEQEDEQADICKSIAIITKPFALDTRQYKHIERMIINCSWTNENDFYIVLFASDDGVRYSVLKSIHQRKTSSSFAKQDYYISRALRGCKYAMLWVVSRSWANTHLAGGYIEFREVRNIAGIR